MPPRRRFLQWAAGLAMWPPATLAAARPPLIIAHSELERGRIWFVENGRTRGLAVDILEETLVRRADIPVVYRGLPWVRAQGEVSSGRADALLTVPLPERLVYAEATVSPLLILPRAIVFAADHPRRKELDAVTTLADLDSFTYVYDRLDAVEVERAARLRRSVSGNDDATVLRMVARGRGDFTVMSAVKFPPGPPQSVAGTALVARILPDLGSIRYHLLIRRSHPDVSNLIPRIDAAAGSMRTDGTLDTIMSRYIA